MATPVEVMVAKITNVRKHPGADKLDIAEVLGWQVVVGRGQYKDGDTVVFFSPDTIIPAAVADRLGCRPYLKGSEQDRVGQQRLRGEPSFGLVVPPDDPAWIPGANVAEHYGATKYIPPLRATCGDAEVNHPLFYKYTDIQNLRNHPTVFNDGEEVICPEKIDGTNDRIGLIDGERFAGSMDLRRKFPFRQIKKEVINPEIIVTLGQANIDLCPVELTGRRIPDDVRKLMHEIGVKQDDLYTKIPLTDINDPEVAANTYWFPWTIPNVQRMMHGLAKNYSAKQVILYGEVYGSGIANGLDELNYGVIGRMEYRAFDLMMDNNYVNYLDFLAICDEYGVATVPVLYRGPFDMRMIKEISDGQSTLAGHIREGTVVHPVVERTHPEVGRLVMKYLGNTYLLKKKRDFKDV